MGEHNGRATILLLLLCLLPDATGGARNADRLPPIVFTQSPVTERTDSFGFRFAPPIESRIAVREVSGELRILTGEFAAACDPCVSFDGKTVLFSARKSPGDRWNIWEMDVAGTAARQITSDLGDCREPAYLARSAITPPEFTDKVRWIVFTSTAAGTYDESGQEIATALYVQNLEPIAGRGTVTWRTTFNLSHDFSPTVLQDGRVLYSSWQRLGDRFQPHGMVALMTTNWAGTGLNAFYGNHNGETIKSMACETADRTLVFVESDGTSGDGSGQLASVSFKRPLHSHRSLSSGDGRYRTPHSISGGNLLVSYAKGDRSYGLYVFDYDRGEVGREVYDDPDWDDYDGVPVETRAEPMGRITIVVDSRQTGHLQCLNLYDSDRPEMEGIGRGDVVKARFVEGVPVSQDELSQAKHARMRILGEAPVEPDGSFYVELPADTPFFIQALDASGTAVHTMRAWMWVRRGSRRGCVGCHENKELAPVNRATEALIKAEPTRLLTPPEERRIVEWSELGGTKTATGGNR